MSTFKLHIDATEPADQELSDMACDGLENIAGYICHKLKDDLPNIAVSENHPEAQTISWVDFLSEGGLTKPTQKTMAHMKELHNIFEANNRESLLVTNNYLKKHMEQANYIDCDDKIKSLFFRSRMYFKIRKLNQELFDSANCRKRKYTKIIK